MPSHPASTSENAASRPRQRYANAPEQCRQQLMDTALSVILQQGYSGVSIEAIAHLAGVTRPVVYHHYPTLGLLLQALIEREDQYAVAQLEHVVPDDPGELDPARLAGGVRRFRDAVASRQAGRC